MLERCTTMRPRHGAGLEFHHHDLEQQPRLQRSLLGVFDTVAAKNGIHRQSANIRSEMVFENGTLNERIDPRHQRSPGVFQFAFEVLDASGDGIA